MKKTIKNNHIDDDMIMGKVTASGIIASIEGYMKNLTISKAKEILFFETYCNPILKKGKYISPPKNVRKSWDILTGLLHPEFVRESNENQSVVMKIVYGHFYKNKNYWNGCTWTAGFVQDLLESKVKNKKMIKTW